MEAIIAQAKVVTYTNNAPMPALSSSSGLAGPDKNLPPDWLSGGKKTTAINNLQQDIDTERKLANALTMIGPARSHASRQMHRKATDRGSRVSRASQKGTSKTAWVEVGTATDGSAAKVYSVYFRDDTPTQPQKCRLSYTIPQDSEVTGRSLLAAAVLWLTGGDYVRAAKLLDL